MKDETLRKKAERFHKKFDTELKGEYIRLSEFTGAHEPLTALHIPCGEIRTAAARDFFRKGCPICARAQAAKKRADIRACGYIKQIETEYNVTALTEYKGPREPMTWQCNVCGAIIERPVENILWRTDYGGGMQHDCFEAHKRLARVLKIRVHQLEIAARENERKARMEAEIKDLCAKYEANGYRIIKVYDDMQRVVLQHIECGRKFTTDKKRMKNGYGCTKCAERGLSFGAQQIRTYLEAHGFTYKREVCFDTCRIDNPLPFDFIVCDSKGRPTHAIEFDGEHHYKPIKYLGGVEKVAKVQAADKIKADWCRRKGLPFLVIRYDADVTEELKKFLP